MKASIYYLDWTRPETFGRASDEFRRFYDLMSGNDCPTVEEVHGPEYKDMGEIEIDPHKWKEFLVDDVDVPKVILEAIFKDLQGGIGRGTEVVLGVRARSMCVGDVVEIKGNLYMVGSIGFEWVV